MSKKILIVEGAAFTCMMLKDMLTRGGGYEVAGEVFNGKDALELYQTLRPDLTLIDIIMPDMDGIQVLKEILAYDANARIVMVAPISHSESLVKCIAAGAKDYVLKPFQQDQVLETVSKVIG